MVTANGGHHNLGDAIDAIDHGLELRRPGAGRLLVIVTDGVALRGRNRA
ncbi:hypothetical protein [Streptomyces sp. NPDC059597]